MNQRYDWRSLPTGQEKKERLDVATENVRLAAQVKHRDLVEGCANVYSLATLPVVHVGPPRARPKISLEPRATKEDDEMFTSASTSCLAWTRGVGEDRLPLRWHLARRRGK